MSRFTIIICLLIVVIGAFVISGFVGFFEHKNNACVSNNPEYREIIAFFESEEVVSARALYNELEEEFTNSDLAQLSKVQMTSLLRGLNLKANDVYFAVREIDPPKPLKDLWSKLEENCDLTCQITALYLQALDGHNVDQTEVADLQMALLKNVQEYTEEVNDIFGKYGIGISVIPQ